MMPATDVSPAGIANGNITNAEIPDADIAIAVEGLTKSFDGRRVVGHGGAQIDGDKQRSQLASAHLRDRLGGWPYRTRTSTCKVKDHLFDHSAIFGFSSSDADRPVAPGE
jgi:hypothetical protein